MMMEPKIRFFKTEHWNCFPFSEIAVRKSTSAISEDQPYVEYEDIISGEGTLNKDLRTKAGSKRGILFTKGDVLFGKLRPYLKNILYAEFDGVAVGDFWVLRSDKIVPKLLYILVNSNNFMKVANISSGSKMPRADWNLVSSTKFYIPQSKDEQRALATFFTSLDNQISAAEKRLASLKQVKAASLQAMFPQEGETTPKLRFKGCEGEWEKVKLGECGTFSKGKGYSKAGIRAEGTPIILYGSMYTNYSTIIDKVDTYAKMNDGAVLSKGGEIIIPASGETPEDIAIASVVKRNGILLGGDLNIITLGDGYDSTFIALGITYSRTHIELSKYAQGKSVVHLHNSEIAQGSIMCPNSLPEQHQIASYFTALDRQITAQSSKISKLKQIKSACLDQMFV